MRFTPARIARVTVLAVIAAAFLTAPAAGRTLDDTLVAENATNQWLVELSGSAADFRNEAKKAGINYKERFEFSDLWKGVSIEADASKVAAIRSLPGVTAVYPNQTYSLPPIQPDLNFAGGLTGADIAQNELGLTSEGVKVLVMDSGIDHDHPDLGGCFGAGLPRREGHDFVGDVYNAGDRQRVQPDPVPRNRSRTTATVTARTCAGIIGANGADQRRGARGHVRRVPRVRLRRPNECDIMLAAMEMAARRRHGRAEHEHRFGLHPWPVPTAQAATGSSTADRRRRLDRQPGSLRPLLRGRARPRRLRDRRRVVRQHARRGAAPHVGPDGLPSAWRRRRPAGGRRPRFAADPADRPPRRRRLRRAHAAAA